jgi:hypothetical protein
MDLIDTATRNNGREAWEHLLHVAQRDFPLAFPELKAWHDRGVTLSLYLRDSGTGYALALGRGLSQAARGALAATAAEVYEQERTIGQFHAERVAEGYESEAYGRACCPGPVIGGAFDERFAELAAEQRKRAAKKRRRKGLPRQ